MNKYSKFEIAKVKADADIRRIIPEANENKYTQDLDCPFCGKEKKFRVSHKKGFNNARCWACDTGFSGPLEAYAHYNHLDIKHDFIKVLEGCANQCGVIITPEEEIRKNTVSTVKKTYADTFCARQLEASGLTVEDVMATVIENGQEYQRSPFRPGSVGQDFMPDPKGDDMLIYYYDLYGRPMTYTRKGSRTLFYYFRPRYANPDLHTTADGTAMKYQTLPGAPVQVFIPEVVRRKFLSKTHIEVLFLQEGEKKAEKACKHGMISVGLQGIMNIGNKDQGLIQSIQEIVRVCQVRHVVFVMDSDWNDLSRTITTGDWADKRPRSFAAAVIKYKQYIRTFHNLQLDVDAWWGHVNANDHGDKGVDDLLVGSLKGREDELMEDIDRTMHSHDGKGKWLDIHKITAMSDEKIRDFWYLNDSHAFFSAHKDRLMQLSAFKLGGVRYRVENGSIMATSRYSSDADIYEVKEDSKGNPKVEIDFVETLRFLAASGFYRMRLCEEDGGEYCFIHIDDGIVSKVRSYDIRDFIMDYIQSNVRSKIVLQYFSTKIDSLLADKKLERLEIRSDTFNKTEPDVQRTYYNNGQVEITSRRINAGLPISDVWRSRIIARNFRRVEVIRSITKADGRYYWELTEAGEKCEFLQYLINTSNNYYTYDAPRDTTDEENAEWLQHIVNKITAIGFLLADYKYPSDRQAVVVQDHRISEVGQAWGGAGKSVLGTALSKVTTQLVLEGQSFSIADEFILSGVTKATRNIFIDDIKTNFDFKNIFNWITGPLPVNPKGKDRFTIPAEESPKMLITTNHAVKGADEGSVKRRIAYVEFSAWYNQDFSPVEEFHHMLFDDWDEFQWALFDNLMAECVMYYFRSLEQIWHREGRGVVPPPMKNIELRSLRQSMSETLLQWADEYFDPTGTNLNRRIARNKELWQSFSEFAGKPESFGVTRAGFKKKIQSYCKYKGYDFNPDKPMVSASGEKVYYAEWKKLHPDESYIGDDDKSASTEYFTVYSPDKTNTENPF